MMIGCCPNAFPFDSESFSYVQGMLQPTAVQPSSIAEEWDSMDRLEEIWRGQQLEKTCRPGRKQILGLCSGLKTL